MSTLVLAGSGLTEYCLADSGLLTYQIPVKLSGRFLFLVLSDSGLAEWSFADSWKWFSKVQFSRFLYSRFRFGWVWFSKVALPHARLSSPDYLSYIDERYVHSRHWGFRSNNKHFWKTSFRQCVSFSPCPWLRVFWETVDPFIVIFEIHYVETMTYFLYLVSLVYS